jgi:hypothetical protein
VSPQAAPAREEPLPGGTTNAGRVSRIGDTVRRPDRPAGASTRAVLAHLERVGFDGAPRCLGIDALGREVLTYVPGRAPIAPTPAWALTDEALVSVAELLRRYHDAVQSFDDAGLRFDHNVPARFRGSAPLIAHNDPNLDNIIFRDGRAVALIDFDLAAPASRAWELACAARLWVPLRERRDAPAEVRDRLAARLARFADAYGASAAERRELVAAVAECHRWCYAIVRAAVAEGHGEFNRVWRGGGRGRAARTGRWLASSGAEMRAALGV